MGKLFGRGLFEDDEGSREIYNLLKKEDAVQSPEFSGAPPDVGSTGYNNPDDRASSATKAVKKATKRRPTLEEERDAYFKRAHNDTVVDKEKDLYSTEDERDAYFKKLKSYEGFTGRKAAVIGGLTAAALGAGLGVRHLINKSKEPKAVPAKVATKK
jgi:hypothetical protein